MSLVRWQPDFVAISYISLSKKIAIGPEVCRPSDTRAENLVEAYHRKIQAYHPILVALKNYIASGWTIRIIPWVVGARGLVHEQSHGNMRASVEALAFMCKLRSSPSPQNRILTLKTHYQKCSRSEPQWEKKNCRLQGKLSFNSSTLV